MRIASVAVFLLILLVAAAVILPRVFDTGSIGRNLAAELEASYHIHAERIKISFLPFPRMVMYDVRTTIPETLTASAEAVFVYPKILPLFTGRIVPAEVELRSPRIAARLPEQPPESQAKSSSQQLQRLKGRISQFQSILFTIIPGVAIDSRNGRLDLYSGNSHAFFFEEIDFRSSVHAQRVDFELTAGKSNLWQALAFSGWVDLATMKSAAELNLSGGNPEDLLRYLNMSESGNSGDSQVDLTLTLFSSGPGSTRVDFKASVPLFTFGGGPRYQTSLETNTATAGHKDTGTKPSPPLRVSSSPRPVSERQGTVLSNGALAGSLNIDANGVDICISHFQFEYPRLNLTASYIERYSDQSVNLKIDGRDTDAATVKNIMLAVNKEDPVTRRVFEIIREAEVPVILFSSHASKASDLLRLENFTLKSSIEKGTVFAPKADLLVSNVSGNLLVEGGVLIASHLSGQTAGSSTSDGVLKIGLRHEDPLFHLDLPITADLSELPEVLNRVVRDQAFRQELAQIKDVEGKAQGRLVLGEDIHDLNARVETGPFQLSGRYGRLPEPVELEGGSFLMEGKKVTVTSLAGQSGSSSFERADLSYDWGEAKILEINSQAGAVISMDLMGPRLRAHEYWKNFMDTAPKGLLTIDSLRFWGPPGDRSKWVFRANGSVENVVFQSGQLGGPVTLKTGSFEIDGDQIVLKEVNAALADSSLSISGSITGYIDRANRVDLELRGRLGPEGNKIAASLAGFPRSLRAVSNLNLTSSRLTWDKQLKTTFRGEMELSAGPRITINLAKTPHDFSIEELVIKDEDSEATISMYSRQNQLKIEFSGKLSNKTADRLLVDNKVLTGPIAGKFAANLYRDTPGKSSAQGEVSISGFQLPLNLAGGGARIETAAVEARGNKLNVKSAMISWKGSRMSLTGSIAISDGAYLVDMNAFADSMELESILPKAEDGELKEEVRPLPSAFGPQEDNSGRSSLQFPGKAWEAPFKGTIRVRSEHLSYGKVNWNPAEADVVLTPGSIAIRLSQANLCGISTPGTIKITPEGLSISLSLSAKDKDLESTLACLFNKKHILSGKYTLTGSLSAKGSGDSLLNSLEGDVELKAKDGRIFRFETLGKIISLLSVSEIYRGVIPDLIGEGCAYKSIESKGKIKNGKLVLSDSVIDGPCIKTVFHGEIDLVAQKVDVIGLVAPMRTVERVLDATPIMGKVLNETFVTLPVHISGDLSDPSVILLSPTAVGEELFGVMKKIVKLPLSIFQQPHAQND